MADTAPSAGPILVVDDEPLLRDLLREQLELAGHTVLTAGNGEEGVAHLEAHAGDLRLLVLDPKCPNTNDAHRVLGALRRLSPDLPVLVLSGDLREDAYHQLDLPASGGDLTCGFLHKPYRGQDLEAKVAALARA